MQKLLTDNISLLIFSCDLEKTANNAASKYLGPGDPEWGKGRR